MSLRRMANFGWTPWHAVAALVMGLIGAYVVRIALEDIYNIATHDEESSHIFLVPIVAAWMFMSRRVRLRLCRPRGMWVGPMLVALGWFAYVQGYNHAMQSVWHGGALLVVLGCVLSVLGKDVFFRFLPAFLVLVFLIPVPGGVRQAIANPLQAATAQITQTIFETIGIAVQRSGNVLQVNGRHVAVAEACNGMRGVFALVLVSYAFAFSMPLRRGVRALVLIASPVAALLCNVIRLVPTVWLYGFRSQKTADMFHDLSGWIMLPIAFLLLLGVIRVLRWAMVPVARFNLAYQ
jgi:exosortase